LVFEELKRLNLSFKPLISQAPGQGTELIRQSLIQGYRNFLVVGGDGSLHEAINGVFSQNQVKTREVTIGLVPVGTGNDWIKTHKYPTDLKQVIGLISNEKTVYHDVGKISCPNYSDRFFLNVSEIGFGGYVVKNAEVISKWIRLGPLTYMAGIVASLFQAKEQPMKIKTDNELIEAPMYNIIIGNCQFAGAGMKVAPKAVFDDGILDITLMRKLGKIKALRNLKKLSDGSFTDLEEITLIRTTTLEVSSNQELIAESDGELLNGTGPFRIEVIPKAVKMIAPDLSL